METPIARIARWAHQQRTACKQCKELPRRNNSQFCSEECDHEAGLQQALNF